MQQGFPDITVANTFIMIAIAVIGVIGALIIAYLIYIRGKQDDYLLKVRNNLRELNGMIYRFGELEGIRYPEEWHVAGMGMGSFFQIIQQESWEDSPENTFEKEIEEFLSESNKACKKEAKTGFHPSNRALYIKTMLILRDLIQRIYSEFPAPPGDYVISKGSPSNFTSFVKDDFPDNKDSFMEWASKYREFYTKIQRIYQCDIKRIIIHLKDIDRKSEEVHKTRSKLHETEITYYETFFQFFDTILNKILETVDNMTKYEGYQLSNLIYAIIVVIALMIFYGLFIPILVLLGIAFPTPHYMQNLRISLISFPITAFIALCFLIKEVMRK